MMIRRILLAAWLLGLMAAPANAAPLVSIITGIVTAIKASTFLTAIFKIVGSIVLSKLAQSLQPKQRQPGIKTESTGAGSLNPCSFVMGEFATNGVHVCPPMSHGTVGGVPNAYLTYVIDLGNVPGAAMKSLIVDGVSVSFGPATHPDYGFTVTAGKYAGKLWVKYYNGTQVAADPMLLDKYGSYPERPWSSDMVGENTTYAILTFLYDRATFPAFPAVRFIMGGIPLYDPRKDGTVGGVGLHRLANPATWEQTNNPMVMAYNVHIGITVETHIWGGRSSADELPLAWWFAAMNACDVLVDNGTGGTEPKFRAGYEVFVTEEPASVNEELMKAALAQVADMGGRWLVAVEDAGLPVYVLDDDSLIATQGGEHSVFPAPQDTFNAIAANYPDPALQWEPNQPPLLLNPGWETADGGRRVTTVDYPAVPYAAQVQRLMLATVATERRFRTHSEPLPPEALALDLLDAVTWNSDIYGYAGDVFQIGRIVEELQSGIVTVFMRERDADDLDIPPAYYTPPDTSFGAAVPAPANGGGIISTFALGPAAPVALAPVVIDHLDTGWVTLISHTVVDITGVIAAQHCTAMVNAELLGASVAKPLVWRLRLVHAGGTLEAFSKAEWMMPGEVHKMTAAAMAETPAGISAMHIDVSGRGLVSGETIEIDLAHMRVYAHNR